MDPALGRPLRGSGVRQEEGLTVPGGDGWRGYLVGSLCLPLGKYLKGPAVAGGGWIPDMSGRNGVRGAGGVESRSPYLHPREAWCKLPPWLSSFGLAAGILANLENHCVEGSVVAGREGLPRATCTGALCS